MVEENCLRFEEALVISGLKHLRKEKLFFLTFPMLLIWVCVNVSSLFSEHIKKSKCQKSHNVTWNMCVTYKLSLRSVLKLWVTSWCYETPDFSPEMAPGLIKSQADSRGLGLAFFHPSLAEFSLQLCATSDKFLKKKQQQRA